MGCVIPLSQRHSLISINDQSDGANISILEHLCMKYLLIFGLRVTWMDDSPKIYHNLFTTTPYSYSPTSALSFMHYSWGRRHRSPTIPSSSTVVKRKRHSNKRKCIWMNGELVFSLLLFCFASCDLRACHAHKFNQGMIQVQLTDCPQDKLNDIYTWLAQWQVVKC